MFNVAAASRPSGTLHHSLSSFCPLLHLIIVSSIHYCLLYIRVTSHRPFNFIHTYICCWFYIELYDQIINCIHITSCDRILVESRRRNFISATWYLSVSYTHLDVYKRQDVDGLLFTSIVPRCIELLPLPCIALTILSYGFGNFVCDAGPLCLLS